MSSVAQFKFAAKEGALATAHQAMQPAIRFAREDCIDLPPTTYTDRVVPLSAEQARMYKSMVAHFKAEYEGGVLTAMNAAVKAGKLMQIVCGVAYTDDGEVSIPAQPRIDAVAEVIEQSAAKVIVFVPLTGALHAVAEALAKQFRVVSIHGGTSKPQRDTAFADFQSAGGPRVLVAQPATMAHGLSLTAADTIVWFAPAPSSEVYQQANMRIVRPGQKRNTLIVRMQGSPFERIRYLHLEQRKTAQDSLLELFN
jgi:SNF2 family DNA or RNA helicase